MENGLSEVHLVSLPKDVKSLRIVELPYPSKNGNPTRTPSPTKKCQELMFIDDGTSSNSSSATSTKEREKQRHLSGGESDKSTPRTVTNILRICTNDNHSSPPSAPSPSPLPSPPPPPPPPQSISPSSPSPSSPLPPPTPSCHDLSELTPAPSRRLPTVVVLGYQRAVVESQAAAERMHQQQMQQQQIKHHKPTGSSHPLDCPLTLSIGSSGLIDHGLPTSPHGRNNRVKCSDDLPYFAQSPPPPQSSPTSDDINISSSISISPTYTPKAHSSTSPPITVQEASSQDQSTSPSTSPPDSSSLDKSSLLSSSPPDVSTLWPRQVAEDAESIAESVYHQPPKAADRSAAYRLARRLFTLDGFKITDVAKHLCKRNDFSQLVGEEFTSFFDFTDQSIDMALRHFMTKFALTGESQERERILFHFSRRYVACNPCVFVSDDACHTLVCALMLLNTDLHSQSVTRKMSCQEFVSNLMELNNGENGYSSDELKRLYEAFKQEPLRWPVVEVPTFNLMYGAPSVGQVAPILPTGVYGFPGMNGGGPAPNGVSFGVSPAGAGNPTSPTSPTPNAIGSQAMVGQAPYWQATAADPALLAAWTAAASGNVPGGGIRPTVFNPQQQTSGSNGTNATDGGSGGDGGDLLKLFTNPFADMPKDISAKEYMRGFVMRKCVMESRGKRTAMGKRSWKLFYARLRDLTLYLYRDAETAATATRAEEMALGYMKQVYRFQLHCQHLRFYYQHHEQQQQRLMQQQQQQMENTTNGEERSPSSENHTSSTSSGSTITVKADPTISSTVAADKTEDGDTEGEEKPPGIVDTPQTNGTANPPPGPSMPSVLEQQLAAAAFQLPPPPPPPPPPEGVICIAHALASVADDYSKKPNVFRLRTKDGSEYLMQVNDPKELEYWVDKINYVAGLLSAPSLPSAVGSDQTFHRPILPAGVTHLGVHEQLEGHQKRILDLTRDLTELKRRRMSAPSQPNLTYLSRDSITPSPAPSIRSESLASVVSNENEASQQLQQPPSSTLPYIPDSVLKSLQPSSAATLPSSATQHPERSISSAFSTASLGRRRKKSFNALRGGSGSDLAAQRAELDERVAFLEHELTRYKTYSRLLEAELTRLQRMPPQTPASPQTPYGTPGPIRGFWQVCGPSADLQEEPSEGCIGGAASPIVSSLPPPPSSKRGYSPSGMRQTRFQRMQYRQYQMQQRRQQQQFYPPTPILSASGLSPSNPPVPNVQKTHTEEETTLSSPLTEENKKPETIPTAFYEVI